MLFIIALTIGVFIAVNMAWRESAPRPKRWDREATKRDWKEFAGMSVGYSLVALFISGIIGLLVSLMVYEATVDEVPRRFNIESLGDGAGVEGRAFLGSGSVDTEAVFFYYAPRKDGGYGLFHVDANQTAIYEDQTDSGYLIKYCEDATTAPDWLLGSTDEDSEDRYDCTQSTTFEFHIPANSIDRRFNLDSQ